MDSQTSGTWVGVAVAAVVGAAGWIQAVIANRVASKANEHAEASARAAYEAVQLAKSAEERADRLERISTEHRDVTWERDWDLFTRTFFVQNCATDTAYDVELVVDLPEGGARTTTRLAEVPATARIGVRLDPAVRAVVAKPRLDLVMGPRMLRVKSRVTWRSEEQVPGVAAWENVKLRCE